MMRSLPLLALLAVLAFPHAEASGVEDVLLVVRDCIDSAPDVAECKDELGEAALLICAPSTSGCFLCVDFTAYANGDVPIQNAGQLVNYDPGGEAVLAWYGYNLDARSHEKVQSGQWEIRWSSSNEIMCSAQAAGAGA